jgi:hypothetical protein
MIGRAQREFVPGRVASVGHIAPHPPHRSLACQVTCRLGDLASLLSVDRRSSAITAAWTATMASGPGDATAASKTMSGRRLPMGHRAYRSYTQQPSQSQLGRALRQRPHQGGSTPVSN